MKHFLEDEYEYDFKLIGISCHEKNYRVCWGINKELGIALEKEDKNIEVKHKKSSRFSSHSTYIFQDEESFSEYHLISNRSSMGFLLPEQPQADYLLMIKESYELDFDEIIEKIRTIPFILLAFEINVFELKSKENLIF